MYTSTLSRDWHPTWRAISLQDDDIDEDDDFDEDDEDQDDDEDDDDPEEPEPWQV